MMTEQATLDESIDLSASADRSIAGEERLGADIDPELLSFIHEAQRLFGEAEARLRSGAVLPALSSLAAVPPLHGVLMGRCSELLNRASDDSPEIPHGLYL